MDECSGRIGMGPMVLVNLLLCLCSLRLHRCSLVVSTLNHRQAQNRLATIGLAFGIWEIKLHVAFKSSCSAVFCMNRELSSEFDSVVQELIDGMSCS